MSGDDLAGVQACIQAYLDGLYKGDMGLLFKKAFHPDAMMNAADLGGDRIHWTMAEFEKVVKERGAPEAAGFPASSPSTSPGRTRPTSRSRSWSASVISRTFWLASASTANGRSSPRPIA